MCVRVRVGKSLCVGVRKWIRRMRIIVVRVICVWRVWCVWCSALHVITIAPSLGIVKQLVWCLTCVCAYGEGAGVAREGTGGKHTRIYIDGGSTIYVTK